MIASSSPADLRRNNRDLVLRQLVQFGAMSRTQLAERTGLTGAAISRITRELIDVGLMHEGERIELKGRVGRRNVRLELRGEGAYVLGIGITLNARQISIANACGDIIAQAEIDDLSLDKPSAALKKISARADKLIARTGIDRSRLVGGGISVAGRTSETTGEIASPSLLGWKGLRIGDVLSKQLGIPFVTEGRAIALMQAEMRRGKAIGCDNVLLINVGLGAGGAVMLDGRLVRGRANMVGHISHLPIPGDNTPCDCGRRGCVDAAAAGFSILNQLKSVPKPQCMIKKIADDDYGARLRMLAQWADEKHDAAAKAFFDAGAKLGRAIDILQAILDPELVLLAGVAGRQPNYMAGVLHSLQRLRGDNHGIQIATSRITTAESAIWLALDAFVYSQNLDIDRLKTT